MFDLIFSKYPLLPPYLSLIFASTAFFAFIQWLSSIVSPLFSSTYRTLPRKTRQKWDNRFASSVHVAIEMALVWRYLRTDRLDGDRVFGWDEDAATLCAVACGFIYDVAEIFYSGSVELTFVLHGVVSFFIFFGCIQPFCLYYAPRAMIWEVSTPFVNIHWYLDKTSRTGTVLQLINGVCLMTTFFLARLCYGSYTIYYFLSTLAEPDTTKVIGWTVFALNFAGVCALQGLNLLWFTKMIQALRSRFDDPKKPVANGFPSSKVQVKDY